MALTPDLLLTFQYLFRCQRSVRPVSPNLANFFEHKSVPCPVELP